MRGKSYLSAVAKSRALSAVARTQALFKTVSSAGRDCSLRGSADTANVDNSSHR